MSQAAAPPVCGISDFFCHPHAIVLSHAFASALCHEIDGLELQLQPCHLCQLPGEPCSMLNVRVVLEVQMLYGRLVNDFSTSPLGKNVLRSVQRVRE